MKEKFFYEGKLTQIGRLVVIVIVVPLCLLAGMSLFNIINNVVQQKNAVIAQKAEIALLRLYKELSSIQSISTATDKMITYKRRGATGQETHKISWTTEGQPITIDGDVLIEPVKSFSLKYFNKYDAAPSIYSPATTIMIEFTMEIKDHNNTPHIFVNRVVI
jgi:type II secretory pathway pseudopilin PulG